MAKPKVEEKVEEVEQHPVVEENNKELEELALQEQRNYEIITMSTDLQLVLTEYCIKTAWKDQMPKKYLQDYLTRYLRTRAIIDRFEDIELTVISEFMLYNLIFIKEELCLNNYQSTILMNIFFQLLTHNNHKFDNDGEKTKESDYQNFKNLLINHSQDSNPKQLRILNTLQIEKILNFARKNYFEMYFLYEKINQSTKKQQFNIYLVVDEPQQIPPLREALYMGNPRIQIHQTDELEEQQDQEKQKQDQKQDDNINVLQQEEENKTQLYIDQIDKRMQEFEIDLKNQIEQDNIATFQKAQVA